MTQRSPAVVFLLTLVTGGIYGIFWLYWTKTEMVARGAQIPTLFLLFVPIVNYYWLWKWCEGVEVATKGNMSGGTAFLLSFLLGVIGYAIIQGKFNEVAATV